MELRTDTTPAVTIKRKTILLFSFFGITAVSLSILFIFNVVDLPTSKKLGPNLLGNPGFEKWDHDKPISWLINKGCKVIRENKHTSEGKYSLAITSSEKAGGITQTVSVDSLEVYSISYSVRLDGKQEARVMELSYKGSDVRTTTDVEQGIHFHGDGPKWRNYFGRVTGATELSVKFFAQENVITYVDDVKIGTNIKPVTNGDPFESMF